MIRRSGFCGFRHVIVYGFLAKYIIFFLFIEYAKLLSFKSLSRADKAVLSSSGFQADVKALQKVLTSRHLVRDLFSIHHFCLKSFSLAYILKCSLFLCYRFISISITSR